MRGTAHRMLLTAAWKIVLLMMPLTALSQSEKKFITEGNQLYDQKKYADAEKKYKQAAAKNKDSYKAAFNLGDAYYKQKKYEEAAEQFQRLTHMATSRDTLSKAYHNLGNSLLQSKKYKESIDAYKNALKNNPADDDSRYNLSYALQMLKQQEQQQKDKDKDKDQDKNKDKDKDDQQKKDQQKKEEKKDQQKDKQKQQEISREDAQRLLDALEQDEKDLQNKVKKGKSKGVRVQIEKDW